MIFEKSGGAVDWLIVGLGNPGQKYEHTRHNMGFLTVDLLAEQLNVKLNKVKFKSAYNIVRFGGQRPKAPPCRSAAGLPSLPRCIPLKATAFDGTMRFDHLIPDKKLAMGLF